MVHLPTLANFLDFVKIPKYLRSRLWRRMLKFDHTTHLLTCWFWRNWTSASTTLSLIVLEVSSKLISCFLQSLALRAHAYSDAASWLYLLTTSHYTGRKGARKLRQWLMVFHVSEFLGQGRESPKNAGGEGFPGSLPFRLL